MREALDDKGNRILPERGLIGYCPYCKVRVFPKVYSNVIRSSHWAHFEKINRCRELDIEYVAAEFKDKHERLIKISEYKQYLNTIDYQPSRVLSLAEFEEEYADYIFRGDVYIPLEFPLFGDKRNNV